MKFRSGIHHLRLLFAVLILLQAFPVEAKRRAPPKLAPIIFNHWNIRVVREKPTDQNVVFSVEAQDLGKNRLAWRTDLYRVDLDATLESDVQEIPVTEFRLEGQTIRARDSLGRTYILDAATGKIRPSPK